MVASSLVDTSQSDGQKESSKRLQPNREPTSLKFYSQDIQHDVYKNNNSSGSQDGTGKTTKRSHYVAQACLECRKKKLKCSGHRPGPCQKCLISQKSCVYGLRRRKRRAIARKSSNDINVTTKTLLQTADEPVDRSVQPFDQYSISNIDVNAREGQAPSFDGIFPTANMLIPVPGDIAPGTANGRIQTSQVTDSEELLQAPSSTLTTIVLPSADIPSSLHNRDLALELLPKGRESAELDRIKKSLMCFFQHMQIYPCAIDEAQVYSLLDKHSHSLETDTKTQEATTFVALIKSIMAIVAIAEEESTVTSVSPPGWISYTQSAELLKRLTTLATKGLMTIQCLLIQTIYLIMTAENNRAYETIGQAVQLCFQTRLHNQSTWIDCSPLESHIRQRILWLVYSTEKSVSLLCKVPYLMRESDISVDLPPALDEYAHSDGLGIPESETPLASMSKYIPAAVRYGRLVAVLWDQTFTHTLPKPTAGEIVATLDARVVFFQQSLPKFLDYDLYSGRSHPDDMPHFIITQAMILRLLTNTLRLSLRTQDAPQTRLRENQAIVGVNIALETLKIVHSHYFSGRYLPLDRFILAESSTAATTYLGIIVLDDCVPLEVQKKAASGVESALGMLQSLAPGLKTARDNLQTLFQLSGLMDRLFTLSAGQSISTQFVPQSPDLSLDTLVWESFMADFS
ncbi:hypothetical protein NLU13_3728 [Sarocladium strictum]|uniref:Zn(2)-C6 fungal-type domain-containing protein n=1 Tax=Sarocladium strictum TaxID=5046 RepID=A0AA39LAP6_SARSR|nr:hypothetical protein NLU13_3728 [Sarocladium strictum]